MAKKTKKEKSAVKEVTAKTEGILLEDDVFTPPKKFAIIDNTYKSSKPALSAREKAEPFKMSPKYEKCLKEGTVIYDIAWASDRTDLYGDCLYIILDGKRCVIPEDELDRIESNRKALYLVGTPVHFIITAYDKKQDIYIGSRKKAQQMLLGKMINTHDKDKVIQGRIMGFIERNKAAFVEADGVFGILRSEEFTDEYISISDVFEVGDVLPVKFLRNKEVNGEPRIEFTVPEKYKQTDIPTLDYMNPGMAFFGKVVDITSFGVFVRIMPGVDVLCFVPNRDLLLGSSVKVKLRTRTTDENGKVEFKGKIIV